MELYRVQTLLIRAVTALCGLAAVESDDVRTELVDEASWGLQVWLDNSAETRLSKLRLWCDGAVELVGHVTSSERAFLQAQLALLRLRASLPIPQPPPLRVLAPTTPPLQNAKPKVKNSKRVRDGSNLKLLQAVQTSGPIRSRDLIVLMAGKLSERTVKRSLKDLAGDGQIRRLEKAEGVFYEVIVDNS